MHFIDMRYRLGDGVTPHLRDYIRSRNFVVSQVADDIELSPQAIHDMLSGKTQRPKRTNLEKLANSLQAKLGFDSTQKGHTLSLMTRKAI